VLAKILTSKWTKVVVFLACLIPLGIIIWHILNHDFDANPPQLIEHATGDWTIRFLVFTLAVTPLRKILQMPQLIRFRRMIGLFAFFYVCLHFITYIWLDKFFSWSAIWDDLHKRTYIIAGFTGRSNSLLLAGEIGRSQATAVRISCGYFAGLAARLVDKGWWPALRRSRERSAAQADR
jgi:hypothetical protein